MKKNKTQIYIFILIIVLVSVYMENKLNFTEKLRYPLRYEEIVYQNSELYNVNPYLVFSIMKAESSFFPYAKSRKNAKGLMQIAPITWEWACRELGIPPENIYKPEYNIRAGVWYLSVLLREFDSENLAIIAYNAGSGNVTNWIKEGRIKGEDFTKWDIPFNETRNYIYRVNKFKESYKSLYSN